ncbi:MAG: ATP-binding protein [Phycisphaeraceae bacterium]|nr:ATP-binding protein [Phycisphaeraceae bacterium]
MNADILKRLIRAIADGSQPDLDRLAQKVVDAERKTGHRRLADQLEAILSDAKRRPGPHGLQSSDRASTLRELPQSRRHGEQLATIIPREDLEHDMVLPAATEERFARIECEYAARERLGAYGLRPRKTVLLYGPPGCGKTLGARRLAWNTGLPLMKVRFDALLSSYFGESASNLRSVFIAAKERPCVLLLDECDFIARSRTNSKDIGEANRIVNSLLQLMEEYDAPGLLVATTNVESSLDEALFRRFDDVFLVPPPGTTEITRLLHMTLSAVTVDEHVNWQALVDELTGASAAMVVKAARDAAKTAVLKGRKTVTEAQLREAIDEAHRHKSGEHRAT